MAHEVQLDVSVMFLPHLDIYDLLLERPVAMWNIFVFTIKKQDVVVNGDIYASALWQIVKMCVGFSLLYKNFHSPVFFFFFTLSLFLFYCFLNVSFFFWHHSYQLPIVTV